MRLGVRLLLVGLALALGAPDVRAQDIGEATRNGNREQLARLLETYSPRVYPHFKGGYVNIEKASTPAALMRQLLRLTDRAFLFWTATSSSAKCGRSSNNPPATAAPALAPHPAAAP